jgi:hypothetical protein
MSWIETFSGVAFDPFNPRPEQIRIEDVARGLSHSCRFSGQTSDYYSVAEHSVLVSRLVPPEDALWALLHDASEAYLCDIATPVKNRPEMLMYREAEARLMGAVCTRFGLAREMPASVHRADRSMLAAEAPRLIPHFSCERWGSIRDVPPADVVISCLSPRDAERAFLDHFEFLYGACHAAG